MKIESLIKKYEKKRIAVINPDGFTSWEDLGFETPPEGYNSINDYLEYDSEIEYDERDQVELQMLDEILEDLRKL